MTVLICIGTRPEVIKMAPVVRALRHNGVDLCVMHTGQHEDMAWPVYEFFGFIPDEIIKLARSTPTLSGLTAELLSSIDAVIERIRPSVVLVHGDTSSAAMGALAAFNRQIPVGHVEAGLRSGTKGEPFPEEMNRQLISRIADWHFAPTLAAIASLRQEGLEAGIVLVGNTVVDAALWASDHLQASEQAGYGQSPARQWYEMTGCTKLIVVTAHRRENWGAPMLRVLAAVDQLLASMPEAAVVWPVHLNALVKDMVRAFHASLRPAIAQRWLLTQPLFYPDLIDLMRRCHLLLTDSGGIQEEAVAFKKPILILRNVTERPEVVQCGLGQLVGTDTQTIVEKSLALLAADASLPTDQYGFSNPFGDGTAGGKIANHISQYLGTNTSQHTPACVEVFA